MNPNSKKFHFFEKGVQAYKNYSGEETNNYCCPICGDHFSRTDLESGKLTLEHIPPKSQGGRGIALTCSSCNNKAGYTIDAAVANFEGIKKISALGTKDGKYNDDIKLSLGEGKLNQLNFNLDITNGSQYFYIKPKSNPPNSKEIIKNFFEEHNKQPRGHISQIRLETKRRYNHKLALVGYLKSAFLVCFASFGYTYIFDTNLDAVRKQIQNPVGNILDGYIIQINTGNLDRNVLMYSSNTLRLFLVVIRDTGVVLPLPSFMPHDDVHDLLRSTRPEKLEVRGKELEWPTSLLLKWDFRNSNDSA
ncbi:HNH endonuclease [Oceanidesulfovibrio marinus]|uniref:HNH domain-containing protein n=1 Tax=Oceanidesulfovibrio marinus TaxID=370038 RepID=A0A6P1ZE89_9BACT|nr:HNH endonuclease [Oceanidesulfovibrio marinus]TVM32538.1 hypothetical protein DQK91_14790 [Oceanidesulfovibrio marinus]